ncbi:hypothetical protein Sjap_005821 [Stephania japonica]|uniref:Uncharacterized protein n=1 Tax=Stephania japonica TaxID=461633 RepID=A0AAP0K4S0_9MAGN
MLGSCSHVSENKVIRILKRGEELNETWFPTIFNGSSSSDDIKDGETMIINGCTSSSKAASSKKRSNIKTQKRADNLNARQVIPSSCSSSSNDDDYDFLKAEVEVLKTFSRNLSKLKKDKKAKKNGGKKEEKAKKKKDGEKEDDKPAKKNKKRGNNTKSRWIMSNCSCSCSSSDDNCGMVKSKASVVSSEYDWEKCVVGLYLNSPLPSSLPVPGKTASSLLVSPPPSSLPLPWFLLPVGLLS